MNKNTKKNTNAGSNAGSNAGAVANTNANANNRQSIDKYYNKFLERYKYQLSLNQTLDSPSLDERFENYSSIINTIASDTIIDDPTRAININNVSNELNNFSNELNNVVIMEGEEEEKLKLYVIEIIRKILKLKTDIIENPTFKNISLICTHGVCTTNFFKIPDNLMICILTPLNRVGYYGADFIYNIIDKLKEPKFKNNFLSNPSCYLRDTKNSFLEFATTFYPGQMCNNLMLTISPEENENEHAYYKIDPITHTTSYDTNIDIVSTNETTLLEFIQYKEISGVLFVTCCRSCDLGAKSIIETKNIYILETFTNILNKTIDNPLDSEYNKCNLLLKYEKKLSSYFKRRKINITEHPRYRSIRNNSIRIQRALKKSRKTNRSLSPVSPNTRMNIEQYYIQLFNNEDSISAIKLILLSDLTDKQKYDELNKYFYLNIIGNIIIKEPKLIFSYLFEFFNKSLNNDEKAINYLVSYIFYIKSINESSYFNIMLNSYQKDPLMKNITTLHLSGDISYINLILVDICRGHSFPKIESVKNLNISDNKNLMILDLGLVISTYSKSLEKIDAHNCNILFVTKNILKLDNLQEINLKLNGKLSFDKTILENLDRNPNNYTQTEKTCLQKYLDSFSYSYYGYDGYGYDDDDDDDNKMLSSADISKRPDKHFLFLDYY